MLSPVCSAAPSFRKRSRQCCDGRQPRRIRPVAGDRFLAPNEYIITLSMTDYQKVGADPDLTSDAFAKHLAGYIGEQGWQTYGDVVVRFEQSSNLHTGQFRTRGAVNPDVEPRPSAGELAPPQSDHAFNAEPGVPAMTENSSYGGGQGQGRPGDEYYDDPYAQPHDDPHAAPDPRGGYPEQRGRLPRPRRLRRTRPARRLPRAAGRLPRPRRRLPRTGRLRRTRPARRLPGAARLRPPAQRGGYPDQAAATPTSAATAAPDPRGGYPEQRGGYPEQGGYGQQPAGGGPGYDEYAADYGRGPARQEDGGGYGAPEQRGGYPEQGGGYDQGYGGAPGYGRQDYGQPEGYGPVTRRAERRRVRRTPTRLRLRAARGTQRLRPSRLRPGWLFGLGFGGHVAARRRQRAHLPVA